MIETEFFLQLLMRLLDHRALMVLASALKKGRKNVGPAEGSPISHALSPGMRWPPKSRMRCLEPSATRTLTAAKRADNRPFVPRRQLTERQDAPASIASAEIDLRSGMCRCRGATPACDGKDQCHIARVDLLMPRNADSPLQTALTERVPEWRTHAVAGIGKDASEGVRRRLSSGRPRRWRSRVRSECLVVWRNPRPCHAIGIAGPALRQEQPQAHHHRHLAVASVSETSVWQFAVLPSTEAYCGVTPTEWLPFFGNAVSSMTNTASSPPTSRSACTSSSASSGAASQTPPAAK